MMVSKISYIVIGLGMLAGYILGINVNQVSKPIVHDLLTQHMNSKETKE